MKIFSTGQDEFERRFSALLDRPQGEENLSGVVRAIIERVRAEGDAALLDYTARFDKQELEASGLRVTHAELDAAEAQTPKPLREALKIAARHLRHVEGSLTISASPPGCAGGRWMRSGCMCPAARRPIPPPC